VRALKLFLFPAALLAVLVAHRPADAQQRPVVEVLLPTPALRAVHGPAVRSAQLLTDSRVEDLLRNGFPARVHYTLERWAVGRRWFDDLEDTFEWDAIVRYDPLRGRFHVFIARDEQVAPLGDYATLAAADSAVGEPRRIPIRPPPGGRRAYYALRIEVEMVSVNDLQELERWLRGELRPAVRGRRNPGTAIERGAATLLVKLLGGEKRRYTARTGRFVP
jgi:hypothetical protein